MKKMGLIVLAGILSTSAFASQSDTAYAIKNFKAALKLTVGDLSKSQELQLDVYKSDELVCGGAGGALIANLGVKRAKRVYNSQTGQISFRYHYETVKKYAVSIEEAKQVSAAQLSQSIMGDDECAE